MAHLAHLVGGIPAAAPHYQRLKEVGYKMRPRLPPEVVLADEQCLKAFTQVIVDATQSPAS